MSFSTSILLLILLFFIIIVINYIKSSKSKNSPVNFSPKDEKPHVFCKKYDLKKENVEKIGYIIYVNCFDERIGILVDNDRTICSKEIISYDNLIIEEISNFC